MMILISDAAAIFPANHDDLTVALLTLVFGIAIGVGLACLLIVLHTLRRRPSALGAQARTASGTTLSRTASESPVALPPLPDRWLAISGATLGVVQKALGLNHATACSWVEGLTVTGQQMLFLTPPVRGWILVFGAGLPDPAQDVDRLFIRLTELSRELGQVQFFHSHRESHHHAWVSLDRGQVVRAYAWAGKTVWNQGAMTSAERDCGLMCHDYGANDDATHPAVASAAARNTERVSTLAGRWSIEPALVAARLRRDGQGIAGEISRPKTH